MGLKGLSCFLTGLVLVTGCNSYRAHETPRLEITAEQKRVERTRLRNTIGYENIELKHLDELDFSDEEKLTLPTDLEKLANFPVFQTYRDKQKFRREIYEKYGLSREAISGMSPYELIVKAAELVADNFEWQENRNPKINGFIEDEWQIRKGDCDMYSDYTVHVFNLLKEDNEKTMNVYLASNYFFGRKIPHAWNVVFVVSKSKLQVGMVDTTFYDNGDSLEALDDSHLSKAWRTNFYQALGDYESSREQLVEDIKQVGDGEEKLQLLRWYAFCFYLFKEYKEAIEAHKELAAIYPRLNDDSLYYQGRSYFELGDKEKAEGKFRELIERYPESYWVKLVRRDKLIEE